MTIKRRGVLEGYFPALGMRTGHQRVGRLWQGTRVVPGLGGCGREGGSRIVPGLYQSWVLVAGLSQGWVVVAGREVAPGDPSLRVPVILPTTQGLKSQDQLWHVSAEENENVRMMRKRTRLDKSLNC